VGHEGVHMSGYAAIPIGAAMLVQAGVIGYAISASEETVGLLAFPTELILAISLILVFQ
jgi:hypothetical protein